MIAYFDTSALVPLVVDARAAQFFLAPSEPAAMRLFRYSITYLTLLFTAMAADAILLA